MKTGLVMEGGAMRGLFTCGVIDVLMENNITTDGAIGVSAGCVFGCNFKSKQINRPHRYNHAYCNDERYCSVKSLIQTGNMFNVEFCYHTLPDILDPFDRKAFADNPMKFIAVCTNVNTGKPVYFECHDGDCRDLEYMRASASMPFVSQIVHTEGYSLLDGGIADSIPLKYFENIGYEYNLVILTQPRNYIKKPNRLVPLAKILYARYPKFIETLSLRHVQYNSTLTYIREQETKKKCLVIAPDQALNIQSNCSDPNEIDRVYEIGRKTALAHLEEIKTFLNQKNSIDF